MSKKVTDIQSLQRKRVQAAAAKLAGRTMENLKVQKADEISIGTEGDRIKLYWTKPANQIGFGAAQARILAERLTALADELDGVEPKGVA